MKKTFYILVLCCLQILLFAQNNNNDTAEIKGKVWSAPRNNLKSQPVKNAQVRLGTSDTSITIVAITNDSGLYSFNVARHYGKIQLSVHAGINTSVHGNKQFGFFDDNDKSQIHISKNNIVRDFYLTAYPIHQALAPLLFKYNSVEMISIQTDPAFINDLPEDAVKPYINY